MENPWLHLPFDHFNSSFLSSSISHGLRVGRGIVYWGVGHRVYHQVWLAALRVLLISCWSGTHPVSAMATLASFTKVVSDGFQS